VNDEAEYVCPACGETIVVPVDLSAGTRQEYGEDCPVCCVPLVITLRIGADGEPEADARAE
jgi:hypothetical protein